MADIIIIARIAASPADWERKMRGWASKFFAAAQREQFLH